MGTTVFVTIIDNLKNEDVSAKFKITNVEDIEDFAIPQKNTVVIKPLEE